MTVTLEVFGPRKLALQLESGPDGLPKGQSMVASMRQVLFQMLDLCDQLEPTTLADLELDGLDTDFEDN